MGEDLTEEQKKLPGSAGRIYAIVGLLAVFLANIVAILSNLDQIRKFFVTNVSLDKVESVQDWLSIGVVVVGELGFLALAYWIYKRFIAGTSRKTQLGFLVVAMVANICALTVGLNLVNPIDRPEILQAHADAFRAALLHQQAHQGADAGGFVWSLSGSEDAQAWTTAQALTAMLVRPTAGDFTAANVKEAFGYLERVRVADQGWAYMFGDPHGPKELGVTEINSWVATARALALKATGANLVWTGDERPLQLALLQRDLDEIVSRQQANGGWGPSYRTANERHLRTYSTVMALWALAESRPLVKGSPNEGRYDDAARLGVRWLLNARVKRDDGVEGWWPNPRNTATGAYPGLTAQTIFVLYRSTQTFPELKPLRGFDEVRNNFLRVAENGGPGSNGDSMARRDIDENDKAHDSDRYLGKDIPFTVESSTFLWYPWALAAAAEVKHDATAPPRDRQAADRLVRTLTQRVDEMVKFSQQDSALYPTAEGLLTLNLYLRHATHHDLDRAG